MTTRRKKASETEYVWPLMGADEPCPTCGKLCRPIYPWGRPGRALLLDPDSRRGVAFGNPLALEHVCAG